MGRTRRRLLLAAAVPVAALLALYALRGVLIDPVVKKKIVEGMESALGLRVSVGALGGSYLASFEVRDLRTLESSSAGPVESLDIEKLRLEYSLLSLLRGIDAFLAALSIEIEGARAALKASGGGEGAEEPSGAPPFLPSLLPEVRVSGSALSFEGEGYGVTAEDISLNVATRKGAKGLSEVRLEGGSVHTRLPALREETVSLAALLVYGGGQIDIEGIDVNGQEVVRGGGIDLRGLPGSLSASVDTLLFGGETGADVEKRGETLALSLRVQDLDLERADGILAEPVGLAGTLAAAADIALEGGRIEEMRAEADVSLAQAGFRGIAVDSLSLRGSTGDGRVTVASLEGRRGENAVTVLDLSAPLAPLVRGDAAAVMDSWAGTFSLDLKDIPSLLDLVEMEPVIAEEVPSHRLLLTGELEGRSLRLGEGGLQVGDGAVALGGATLTLPPAGAGPGETALSADLTVELPELELLGKVYPPADLGGSLAGEVRLEGTLASLTGKVELRSRGFAVADFQVGDIDLRARADSGTVIIERGSLSQALAPGNELTLSEVSAPAPLLFGGRWLELLRSLRGGLSLRLEDTPALLALFGVETDAVPGGVPLHRIGLKARAAEGRIDLAEGVLEAAGGKATLVRGSWQLPPPGEPWGASALEAELRVDLPDLAVLPELFPLPPLQGSLQGRVKAEGSLASLAGEARLEAQGVAVKGITLGKVAVDARAGEGLLELRSLEVTREGDALEARGAYEFAEKRLRDGVLEIKVAEIGDYVEALVPGERVPGGTLQGKISAEGVLPWPAAAFEIELKEGRVGDFDLSAVRASGRLEEKTLRLEEAAVESDEGRLRLAGSLRGEEGAVLIGIDRLEAARGETEMALAETATVTVEEWKLYRIEPLRLSGTMGQIGIQGLLNLSGDSDLLVTFGDLTGEGWLEELVGDRFTFRGADLEVGVKGPLQRPEVTAAGSVAEFRGRQSPLPLSLELDAGYSSRGISVGTLEAAAGNGEHFSLSGTVPYDPLGEPKLLPGKIVVTAQLAIPDLREIAFLLPPGYEATGSADGNVSVTGTWQDPVADVQLQVRGLTLPEDVRPAPPGPLALDCGLAVKPGTVTLRDLRLDSPSLSAAASGSWTGVPALIRIARGEEAVLQGDVSLSGSFEAADLSWVGRGVDALRSTGGGARGTFTATGAIGSPRVDAEAELDGLIVKVAGVPPAGGITGHLSLQGGTLRIPGLKGDLGGAPFELAGTFSGIGGDELAMDLGLKGTGLLLYRDEGVRVRADADLAARGPLAKLTVSGSVMLTDSRYVRNIDLLGSVGGHKAPKVKGTGILFSFRDPPLRDLVFDLRFGTKEPFLIRNQFFRGSVSPDLRLGGTGEEPLLAGKVTVDFYRAQLPTGVMRGEEGVVAFLKTEPNRPWIEVPGETRMMGYDITMNITGFADDPKIIFSSVPPLPSNELLLLVLAGTPPKSADKPVAGSSGAALSLFLARGFLSRFFGNGEETDDMILDRLETEVGREITESGDPTIESTFRLREGIFWEGDTLYLTSGKDRYDDFNYGVRFTVEFQNKEKGEKD